MSYETCEYCDGTQQRHLCHTCMTTWCRACEGGCMCTHPEGQWAFAKKWGLSMVIDGKVVKP